MDSRIVAGICTYNNADYIRAVIESIIRLVDLIIVVDGRYEQYPQINGSDNSTDGTLEIVLGLDYENIIVVTNAPYQTQVAQRNHYMRFLNDDDWIWIIDGDEIVHTDHDYNSLRQVLDASPTGRELVTVTNAPDDAYGDRYRFVKFRGKLRYVDYHWKVVDLEGDIHHNIISPLERELQVPLDRIEHIHMKHQRGDWVQDNKTGNGGAWFNQMRIEQFKVLDDARRMMRIHNYFDGSIMTEDDFQAQLDEINRKITVEND